MEYFLKSFDGKKVFWFKDKNQYLVSESSFSILLEKCIQGISFDTFIAYCKDKFKLSEEDGHSLFENCTAIIVHINSLPIISDQQLTSHLPHIYFEVYSSVSYHWNGKRIHVNYGSKQLEDCIHPKFSHLQIAEEIDLPVQSTFNIFEHNNQIVLRVDEDLVGTWSYEDSHLFQGKFSMKFLSQLTSKEDCDWLATLHASAVYKQGFCLVLLGESGKGKSTTTSLLMTHGYELLADDFVPIEAHSKKAFPFPQAISIKNNIEQLTQYFPVLTKATSRQKNSEVQFRYLYPEIDLNQKQSSKFCKAFVFVNYKKGSATKLMELSKTKALEALIPDSWISPVEENSMAFLDAILETPCYTLEYSRNSSMLNIMDQLMQDELQ